MRLRRIPQLKSRRGGELKVSDACRRTADHSDVANVVRPSAILKREEALWQTRNSHHDELEQPFFSPRVASAKEPSSTRKARLRIFAHQGGARMRDFNIPTRSAAIAEHGMAATSHPFATLAAIDMLRKGGNAIDAAITAVAVQSIVEPHMTGIGGDCFVVYSPKAGTPLAFNGSGRAPAGAECEWYLDRKFSEIPGRSPRAVTIPGAIDAWCRLLARLCEYLQLIRV
jgi:Gamma-glutamyltranspeptidase